MFKVKSLVPLYFAESDNITDVECSEKAVKRGKREVYTSVAMPLLSSCCANYVPMKPNYAESWLPNFQELTSPSLANMTQNTMHTGTLLLCISLSRTWFGPQANCHLLYISKSGRAHEACVFQPQLSHFLWILFIVLRATWGLNCLSIALYPSKLWILRVKCISDVCFYAQQNLAECLAQSRQWWVSGHFLIDEDMLLDLKSHPAYNFW